MAIYQIEISDDDAAVLVANIAYLPDSIDPQMVAKAVCTMITRYKRFPRVEDEQHRAAMAFVRAEAVKAAASASKDGTNLEYAADRLTSFILGGR